MSDYTKFPNGVSGLGGTACTFGVTSIVAGVGTVTTGLSSCTGIVPTLAGVPGTATTQVAFVSGTAHGTSGAAIVRTYLSDLTAASGTVNVSWAAFGTG